MGQFQIADFGFRNLTTSTLFTIATVLRFDYLPVDYLTNR